MAWRLFADIHKHSTHTNASLCLTKFRTGLDTLTVCCCVGVTTLFQFQSIYVLLVWTGKRCVEKLTYQLTVRSGSFVHLTQSCSVY